MQPSGNRPVFIVQPSSITHLNVRPSIITTGGQQLQPQQQQQAQSPLTYQVSNIHPSLLSQQGSQLYQASVQPRPTMTASINNLQSSRFITTAQPNIATNTNLSPRPVAPQTITRLPLAATPQPTTTITRPATATVSTPPMSTSAPTSSQPPAQASNSKEFPVRFPKTQAQYGVMEFANGLAIDVKDWKSIEMKREVNPYTYRPATTVDANSSGTTITTSTGTVIPKVGAGSEYGREQKEALKRKRYTAKGTNIEDLPWVLTDRSSKEKHKCYRGLKKGGISSNSSYYVFIQGKDGFEAYPVEDWYSFTPTNVYKTLDFEEAEKKYEERHKHLSKWFLKHQITKSDGKEDDDEEKGSKTKKNQREFKLLDADDWIQEEEEEDDDDDDENDNEKSNKKSKKPKKNSKKPKQAWTLSDDDEDDKDKVNVKKRKTVQRQKSEGQEDSDDGDHECDEIDYTSDETSEEEDDIKDAGTLKSSVKYEAKGVDEELATIPDIEKKLEKMDENDDGIDFDDEDDEIPEIDDGDDESSKPANEDFSEVTKLLKNEAVTKEIESSSDDDDMDDSDETDKDPMDAIFNPISAQATASEQIKTEKGHKKAREEEMRALKSKVMSMPATPSNPCDLITDEKVRNLLTRKQHMTFSELIQNFLPKEELRTKEIKDSIVRKLAAVLKSINIEEKLINGKKHIKLKTT